MYHCNNAGKQYCWDAETEQELTHSRQQAKEMSQLTCLLPMLPMAQKNLFSFSNTPCYPHLHILRATHTSESFK